MQKFPVSSPISLPAEDQDEDGFTSADPDLDKLDLLNCIGFYLEWVGLDNKRAGVLEPAMSKIKSLKFATEAAIIILRILLTI